MNNPASSRLGRVGVGHIALAIPVLAATVAARGLVRDNSYLWHVRAGTVQIDSGVVLTTDPFSFTARGRAWRTQSWLMDLLYGWGDRLVGLDLVTPLVFVGSTLLVLTLALRVYRAVNRPLPAAVGLAWMMWLTIGYFTPRPVLFSLLLLGVLLLVADEAKLRWAIPLVTWIWSAVHGGFVVGLGYLVLDGFRRRDKRRVADVVGGIIAASLTAHGWGTWQIVVDFLGNQEALDLIVEWLTPNFISLPLFPFALGVVAILISAIRGRILVSDLWVIIPFLLFAFSANRSVPLAAIVLAPFLVTGLRTWRLAGAQATRTQSRLNVALVSALVLVPWLVPVNGGLDTELFAIDALAHVGPGRFFHDDAVGGFLIYSEWPARHVFIDDRAELYGSVFIDYVKTRGGTPVWEEVFERFDLRQALLNINDPLREILLANGWKQVYQDLKFSVLVAPEDGPEAT